MFKILIIEDDYEVIDNLSEILTLEGYNVIAASNAKIGIGKAEDELPDLIICDITMPEMDGFQVLKALRESPNAFAIPLVFLTAKTEKSDQRMGMELGADDYVTKPFTNIEISNTVKTQLEKHTKSKKFFEKKLEELRFNVASTIPHELRTPLNTILGFTQILQYGYEDMEKQEVDVMLKNIFQAGKRLLRLIVNYTYYTKLLISPAEEFAFPETEIFKTDELITRFANELAMSYGRINDLTLNLTDYSFNFSEEGFSKIVEELIDNAFKFSTKGNKVKVTSFLTENDFILTFENSGRALTAQQIKEIGAFFQFDRKLFEQQGSGLGLAIVKKILDIYHGSVDISSIYGDKTLLSVSIPLRQIEKFDLKSE